MATVAELQAKKAELTAEETRLKVEYKEFDKQKSAILDAQRPLNRELRAQKSIITDPNASQAEKDAAVQRGTELEAQINASDAEFRKVNDQQTAFLNNTLRPVQDELYDPVSGIGAQIERAQREEQTAAKASADQGPGTSSAGDIATESAIARDDNASAIAPPEPISNLDPPAQSNNAEDRGVVNDVGTEESVRSIENTQSNPPPTAATPVSAGSGIDPYPGNRGYDARGQVEGQARDDAAPTNIKGTGAPGEDAATQPDGTDTADTAAQTTIQGRFANRTDRPITAQPNILDRFSSYTYTISLYLMSPEEYAEMMTSKKRYVNPNRLLIQSAGAPVRAGTDAQGGSSRGRNQYFPEDFYIDDVELTTLNPGKGTGGAHNVSTIKFKIIEPNGITLLNRLNQAIQDYIQNEGGATVATANGQFGAQNYLMVIRFYGYDANGVRLTAQQISSIDPGRTDKTDVDAIVEKFIPFQFSNIKFRIANRLVEYQCEAVAIPNIIGTGQGRGVIPYNVQITATTLENLFNGNASYVNSQNPDQTTRDTQSQTPTAPTAVSAAPTPTVVSGLVQALNRYQEELVEKGTYTFPDIYRVVISHPEIANSSIIPPGETDRKTKPMADNSKAGSRDTKRQSVQNTAKTVSVIAGTSIVQFLDQAVQRSDYIYKQQTKIKGTDKNGKEIDIPQNTGGRAFVWYTINIEARPRGKDFFDPKRNDYAYEIIYEIAPYAVSQIKSEYFPKGRFRGTQKRYAYWFTGENNSILQFEQDFNYLYYITVNSRQLAPNTAASFNYAVAEKRFFSPNSGQSNQGVDKNVNEPVANAADYLYSPGDQGRVNLKIIGDPGWIAQGTVWSGIRGTKKPDSESNDVYFDAFLSDGTINYDAREVLFEIRFNTPSDYSIETGVLKGF